MTHRYEFGSATLGLTLGWTHTRRLAETLAEAEQVYDPTTGTMWLRDRQARRGRPNLWHKPLGEPWQVIALKGVGTLGVDQDAPVNP
jgi:hypothetical protein